MIEVPARRDTVFTAIGGDGEDGHRGGDGQCGRDGIEGQPATRESDATVRSLFCIAEICVFGRLKKS